MSLIIYRQYKTYYLFEGILFDKLNTDELFTNFVGKRNVRTIQAHTNSTDTSKAVLVAGLSKCLKVLDSACIISGEEPPKWGVVNLIINTQNTDHHDLLAQIHVNTDGLEPKNGINSK